MLDNRWKFGQLQPGNTVQMHRITYQDAMRLRSHSERWLDAVEGLVSGETPMIFDPRVVFPEMMAPLDTKLHVSAPTAHKPRVVFRQVGLRTSLSQFSNVFPRRVIRRFLSNTEI